MQKPFPQSFWVAPPLLCAGQYPGAPDPDERDAKLNGLLEGGISQIVRLMEPDETSYSGRPFAPYAPRFLELAAARGIEAEVHAFPIPDEHPPTPEILAAILERLKRNIEGETPTYLHCWGGHGRTGTIVVSFLVQGGMSPDDAITQIMKWRADLPRSHYPFHSSQERFIRALRFQ